MPTVDGATVRSDEAKSAPGPVGACRHDTMSVSTPPPYPPASGVTATGAVGEGAAANDSQQGAMALNSSAPAAAVGMFTPSDPAMPPTYRRSAIRAWHTCVDDNSMGSPTAATAGTAAATPKLAGMIYSFEFFQTRPRIFAVLARSAMRLAFWLRVQDVRLSGCRDVSG